MKKTNPDNILYFFKISFKSADINRKIVQETNANDFCNQIHHEIIEEAAHVSWFMRGSPK